MRRAIANIEEQLPNGIGDLFRQFGLFFLAYNGYQIVRGVAESRDALAFANADRLVELERSVGLFFEQNLQSAALGSEWIINAANYMYMNSHFTITVSFLAWLYLFRNQHFYFVRNVFMVTMGLALVGYLLYPTAPPRLLPELGFVGTIDVFAGVSQDGGAASVLVNKYAAVPSMHCAFALIVGITAFNLVRNSALKVLWLGYPVLVFFVTILTGNHYWIDGTIGAIAVAIAVAAALGLARARPTVWAFRPATGQTAA